MTEIQLFDAIQNNHALVLTANRRLAGFFQQKFTEFQFKQNKSVWISPEIYSFQDYLLKIWADYSNQTLSDKTLLTPFQSYVLWRENIEKTALEEENLDDLLNLDATIDTAMKAWELIQAWNLSPETLPKATHIDEHIFQIWAKNYQQKLRKNQFFDQTMLCHEISYLIQNKEIYLPQHVIFSGFDTFTPQQEVFIAHLKDQGTTISFFEFSVDSEFVGQLTCFDEDEELNLVASFCQQQIKQGCQSIAVVVPDLQQKRNKIERIFSRFSENFNISAGSTLSAYPVIDIALKLIAFTEKPLHLNDASYLIRSPFIKGAEKEFIQRQKLDFTLKALGQMEVSFKKLLELSQKQSCTEFSSILQSLATMTSSKKTCNEWSYFFLEKLKNCGWPGERSINSEEFQTIERFKNLIVNEFIQIALISEKIAFTTAISLLKKLCQKTIFQPKKTEFAAIQILGLLEASGMCYEKMWITGLTEKQIPKVPQLNPFLSLDLQRKLKMPHSTVEREYQFSKKLIDRLIHSAKEVILSFASLQDDEIINPSPLLNGFTQITKDKFQLTEETQSKHELFQLEPIPYQPIQYHFDKKVLAGGSKILQEQSLCSFRAFAIHRLYCNALPVPAFSITKRERGNIIHKVLEVIWNKIKTQENLKNNFSTDQNSVFLAFITKEIENALEQYDLPDAIFQIEKQHMVDLLLQYFETELEREPFVVHELEKEIEITLNNIKLNLRIDRIDKLHDGNLAIIDYKTRECTLSGWFGDRPALPQLPLYAAFYQPIPKQVLFAQLKSSNCQFIGVSENENNNKNIKTLDNLSGLPWPQQIVEWKKTCEKLMADFQKGEIALNPHPIEAPCKRCEFQPLCRIFEAKEI